MEELDLEEEEKVSKIKIHVWGKIFDICKKRWPLILGMVISSIILACLDTVMPLLNEFILNTFFPKSGEGDISKLPIFIALSSSHFIVLGITVMVFIFLTGKIESAVSYDLRELAFGKLQRLSFSYFDKTQHGWLMARMTSDTKKLSEILSWGLLNVVWAVLSMLIILVVLTIKNWQFGLIMIVSAPIMFLIAMLFQKKMLKYNRLGRKYNSLATGKYNESFQGAKTTKSLVLESQLYGEFESITSDLKKYSAKAVFVSSLFISVLLYVCYIVIVILTGVGTKQVLSGAIGVPTLYLSIQYTLNFFDPLVILSRTISNIQQCQASAERVISLINEEEKIVDTPEVIEKYGDLLDDKVENWEDIDGKIEFKDVSFSYNPDEPILENFNVTIEPRQSIAIVGHTGSGKTTLVNLLCRFYEPEKGSILIDNKDYRERSQHWLHKRLGYVIQAPFLFSTTIKDNIKYGKLDATDEEVIEVSKIVGVHDFIMSLEKGYDTLVGENGSMLSVGQKQLISFARAILVNPRILILDEATSSIDSETENILQTAIHNILQDRTSIVIAHRLSTIVNSDKIFMMEHGKIIESGTHKELLSKKGKYYELYRGQFFQEKQLEIDNLL